MKKILLATFAVAAMGIGCTTENEHAHEDGAHDHEPEAVSYTLWTDKTELFVEFSPFVVGQKTTFAAHFSNMETFKSIDVGSVTASLIKDGKGIRHTVDAPSSPGIFRPALQPKTAGTYQLVFEIQSGILSDKIVIENVSVYATTDEAAHAHPHEAASDGISFLKEQAWKIDFAIQQAKKQDLRHIIPASGKIEAKQGDEIILTAKTNGVVVFKGDQTFIGSAVTSNQNLFTISGDGLVDDNIQSKFSIAKSSYQKAKADFERGEGLVKENIISQKAFDALKAEYDISKSVYNNLVKNYGSGGQKVKAPFAGYLKNIHVTEGQYVVSGTPIAVVTKNQKLVLHADVSQRFFPELANIQSANFRLAYDSAYRNIADYNGRLLSYGKNAEETNGTLPVLFEIDNKGELLSGAFAEINLKTNPVPNAIAIPWTAVMEDYENYYVYVQTSGETFEKRNVQLGVNDGIMVQVISGVKEGEWVVSRGAYQVKMASMSSSIPAHGHSH